MTCTWKTTVCMRHTHCLEHTTVCGEEAVSRWEIRVLHQLMRFFVCQKHADYVFGLGGTLLPLQP